MGWDTARHPKRQAENRKKPEDEYLGIRRRGYDDDEEMPEETGNRSYDTSERGGRYEPIQTNPEEDVIQIHTHGEISHGENIENQIRRSNQNINKPNRYGCIPYTGNFWG